MAKSKVSVYVKCPYYKREQGQKICCEGVTEGSSIHLAFDANVHPGMKDYEKTFCKGDYNKCPIAQMLNRRHNYEA